MALRKKVFKEPFNQRVFLRNEKMVLLRHHCKNAFLVLPATFIYKSIDTKTIAKGLLQLHTE